MSNLPPAYRDVLRTLVACIPDDVTWAVTGSTSFAAQGVPIEPADVDVQATADGVYQIEAQFEDAVVESVEFREAARIRSHLGALELEGIRVELMGGVQKRRPDGTWESPVDIPAHRRTVEVAGATVPVLTLEYEARAYERLGRGERAQRLRTHASQGQEN